MRLVMDADVGGPCQAMCATGATVAGCSGRPLQQPPVQQQQQPQHLAFLNAWHQQIAPRLQQLVRMLAAEEVARALACAQVWTYLPVLTEGRQLLKAEALCVLGDAELQGFHGGCAAEGVTVAQLGPMGKVWESGAVQVVQFADSLPADVHPCNRLGPLAGRIGECIYVPVYDRSGQVSQGVLAVVELLVSRRNPDCMVVANAISCMTALMDALQLSLSNPHAPSAPASPAKAPPAQAQWGSGASSGAAGSGGSLGRSISMRTFG